MRNMSFALTTTQVRAGTKTVTRRMGVGSSSSRATSCAPW